MTADAAAGLSRIDPVWTGPAYEAFWAALGGRREGFVEATRAFDSAAGAVELYAGELAAAKTEAGVARGWWEAGIEAASRYEMHPSAADGGPAFRPKGGYDYFLGVLRRRPTQ